MSLPPPRPVRGASGGALIALVSAGLMGLTGLSGYLAYAWRGFSPERYLEKVLYSRTVITPNYFELGFVRRGLGGTIAHLLSSDFLISSALFDVVALVWLIAPLSLIVARVGKTSPGVALYMGLIVALSQQTFLAWASDPVRTDVLATGFVAWGALATLGGRRLAGAGVVLAGLLVHETAVIFGFPLLVAMSAQAVAAGRLGLRAGLGLGLGFLAGVAGVLLAQAALSPGADDIAAFMLRESPAQGASPAHLVAREIAVYMMAAGLRGVETAVCWNLDYNPQYYATGLLSLLALAAYLAILPTLWRRPLAAAVAVFAPVVFMLLIANDTGRWLRLGVVNAWLLMACQYLEGPEDHRPRPAEYLLGMVIFAAFLLAGHTHYNNVNRLSQKAVVKLGFRPPGSLQGWMDQCDPDWLKVVYGPRGAAGRPPAPPARP